MQMLNPLDPERPAIMSGEIDISVSWHKRVNDDRNICWAVIMLSLSEFAL